MDTTANTSRTPSPEPRPLSQRLLLSSGRWGRADRVLKLRWRRAAENKPAHPRQT